MLDETSGSTVPRRQLGRLFTELREHAMITLDEAARALDCSRQKIWRIEKGLVPVRLVDARAMCDLYRVPEEMAAIVAGLAKETRAKGWWHAYGDVVPSWFSLYVGLESAASLIRRYDSELIPGLLQTRAYASELFRRKNPTMTAEEREKLVAVRLQRQSILVRRLPVAPTLKVVLSEAVLRRSLPDRREMVEQLRHLLDVAALPNVSLRVLPLAAGPPLASETGTFVVLGFPQGLGRASTEPTTVYLENITGALYLDRPVEVAAFAHVWNDLESLAPDEAESEKMINMIIEEHHD
ncbi:helix-turn-helix domain-containing protein [Micromonospora craniellae]|uniref:XRE family transcriptional regulator n=1 Tax=Micromonospora craniellae TaxID=2294034 RepID=A0A372G4Z2_9ACTN|nr:helix-turn-helix transcriptional regulator [Micromonospora craniellae]QOC90530.1 helix-turn-helix domain-containing protein [Micromonospora craniellae]RFS48085.1 XRE family transcriptional regulator [Micromonospora craniellae]